jgi:hypothetical protein
MSSDPGDVEPDWWEPYQAEFPCWHAWRGVGNTGLYARLPDSSPPLVYRDREDSLLRRTLSHGDR